MKRIGLAIAVVTLLAGAACSSSDTDDGDGDRADLASGPVVFTGDASGVVVGSAGLWDSNPSIKLSQDAYEAAIEARGATAKLLQADPRDPVNTLIANLDTLTAQQVQVSSYYPIDPNAVRAAVERSLDAGIPIVSQEFTDSPVTAMVHQAKEAAAVTVAQGVCDLLPDGGEIVYGGYALTDPVLAAYEDGFTAALEECSDGDIVIAERFENAGDDIAGALDPALAALQRAPEAAAIVNYSDLTAIGASRAATQLGIRENLTIFGFNLGEDGIQAVRDGVIDFSIHSPLAALGQYVANLQIDIALGEPVPLYTSFWMNCYGQDNVDELATPEAYVTAAGEGRDLLAASGSPISTSDDALPTEAPADIRSCPVA